MTLHETASRNILTFLSEGRLVQRAWHASRDGKEMACLLGAAAGISAAVDCPAELMPRWMAECTVTLFDGVSSEDMPEIARRYGNLVGRWSLLTADAWDNVLSRWLVRVIDQAIDAIPTIAKEQAYWPAIEKAAADCRRAVETQDKDAAYAASRAAYAAAYAADAAAYAAYTAADAAADAASRTAYAAARAAYKSLFNALLDEIEREIAAAEADP